MQPNSKSVKSAKTTKSALTQSSAPNLPTHLNFLKKVANPVKTANGLDCEIWELTISSTDPILSEWAKEFRKNYCLDSELDLLRKGTGRSRSEYLNDFVFPHKNKAPGPSIRAGDFAELLVADYVEHVLGYWVPRGKYAEKGSNDESVKGVDVLGFKVTNSSKPTPADSMLTFEVKAQLSGGKYNNRLQTAVDDSAKDFMRSGITLAALKRRLHVAGRNAEVQLVERFQSPADCPYAFNFGAAAVLSDNAFDPQALGLTKTANHSNSAALKLVAISGCNLMNLVHVLYQKAADEA